MDSKVERLLTARWRGSKSGEMEWQTVDRRKRRLPLELDGSVLAPGRLRTKRGGWRVWRAIRRPRRQWYDADDDDDDDDDSEGITDEAMRSVVERLLGDGEDDDAGEGLTWTQPIDWIEVTGMARKTSGDRTFRFGNVRRGATAMVSKAEVARFVERGVAVEVVLGLGERRNRYWIEPHRSPRELFGCAINAE